MYSAFIENFHLFLFDCQTNISTCIMHDFIYKSSDKQKIQNIKSKHLIIELSSCILMIFS